MDIKEPIEEVDWVEVNPICKYLYQRLIKVRSEKGITIEEREDINNEIN